MSLKYILSCIIDFFTCRKKPNDNQDELLEYHKIYDNNQCFKINF